MYNIGNPDNENLGLIDLQKKVWFITVIIIFPRIPKSNYQITLLKIIVGLK